MYLFCYGKTDFFSKGTIYDLQQLLLDLITQNKSIARGTTDLRVFDKVTAWHQVDAKLSSVTNLLSTTCTFLNLNINKFWVGKSDIHHVSSFRLCAIGYLHLPNWKIATVRGLRGHTGKKQIYSYSYLGKKMFMRISGPHKHISEWNRIIWNWMANSNICPFLSNSLYAWW